MRPGFQVGVEPPNQRARDLNRAALLGRGWHQLVHQPFGVQPTQRVGAHPELAGCASNCATPWPDKLCPRMVSSAAAFTT